MAKNAIVSEAMAQKFATEKETPYTRWVADEGLDIISAHYVPNLHTVDLKPWARRGGRGVYINHEASRTSNDCYVCEIPPGQKLEPQRQLFEEMIYVLDGRGSTSVWNDAGHRITFEWKAGSMFAIPLNAWHQHFNASGTEPCRYFALTSQPVAFELYRDPEFIYNTSYMFKDRFDPGDAEFFSKEGKYFTEYYGGILHSNFIPDIRKINLVPREKRGKGTRNMYIHMSGSAMLAHVSQFPVGRYKKAHRHGPGAHVFLLDSTGYTLMWNEGEKPERYDWHEGTCISPPAGAWHQHYNTGNQPCKFVALHANTAVQKEEKGVEQIEFEDEDDSMRKMYAEECAKNGVKVDMD